MSSDDSPPPKASRLEQLLRKQAEQEKPAGRTIDLGDDQDAGLAQVLRGESVSQSSTSSAMQTIDLGDDQDAGLAGLLRGDSARVERPAAPPPPTEAEKVGHQSEFDRLREFAARRRESTVVPNEPPAATPAEAEAATARPAAEESRPTSTGAGPLSSSVRMEASTVPHGEAPAGTGSDRAAPSSDAPVSAQATASADPALVAAARDHAAVPESAPSGSTPSGSAATGAPPISSRRAVPSTGSVRDNARDTDALDEARIRAELEGGGFHWMNVVLVVGILAVAIAVLYLALNYL